MVVFLAEQKNKLELKILNYIQISAWVSRTCKVSDEFFSFFSIIVNYIIYK